MIQALSEFFRQNATKRNVAISPLALLQLWRLLLVWYIIYTLFQLLLKRLLLL